jgi:nucleotide-binding universal stress UspA family protein
MAKSSPPSLRTIVIGTDFSVCSARALSYAVSLAAPHGARVHLVHVLMEPVQPIDVVGTVPYLDAGTRADWEATAKERLAREARAAERRGVKATYEVSWGRPSDAIVARATSLRASLVVVGTHGRSKLEQLLLGSTAERVVRSSPVPVLTVREKRR